MNVCMVGGVKGVTPFENEKNGFFEFLNFERERGQTNYMVVK